MPASSPTNSARGIRINGHGKPSHEMTFLTPAEYAAIRAELTEHWRPSRTTSSALGGCGRGAARAFPVRPRDPRTESVRVYQGWEETTG